MTFWRRIILAFAARPLRGAFAAVMALALLSAPPGGWMPQSQGGGLVICTGAGPLTIDDPFAPAPHEELSGAPCLFAAVVALAAPPPIALSAPRGAALARPEHRGAIIPRRLNLTPPARGPPLFV